jgi:hypothetical protein
MFASIALFYLSLFLQPQQVHVKPVVNISGNAIKFTSALIEFILFSNNCLRLDFPKLTKIGLKLYS